MNPPSAETTILVAQIALIGVVAGAITGALAQLVVARINARSTSRNADLQVKRDLAKHRATLMHESVSRAYGQLDAWIATIADQANDLCYGDDLANLPAEQKTEYGICVALHQGVLRLPREGQYLWGKRVAELVHALRDQAVEMATMVILQGLQYPEPHGHDELEASAERLRFAMREELEGRHESAGL